MGGGLALQLAIHEPRLAACVVVYGPLPTNVRDIQKINASVLGFYGALDRGIPPDKVRAFEDCMNAAGKRVGIEIYDGASHAFESPTNKSGYRPEAAADAWSLHASVLKASEANGSISSCLIARLSCEMMEIDLGLAKIVSEVAANADERVYLHAESF